MKWIVCFLGIIIAVQAVTEESKAVMKVFSKHCQEKTGVSEHTLVAMKKRDYDINDPNLGAFSYCMLTKIGVVDEDGNYTKDVAVGHAEEHEKKKVGDTIDKCYKEVGKLDESTACAFSKCFHTEFPESLIS